MDQRRRQSEVVPVSELVMRGVGRKVVEERIHRRVGGQEEQEEGAPGQEGDHHPKASDGDHHDVTGHYKLANVYSLFFCTYLPDWFSSILDN